MANTELNEKNNIKTLCMESKNPNCRKGNLDPNVKK